ncbi:MAG: efflux RND transporter permease subunit, partial [Saprospiraceae bacterium]|nr:efflux RND transporter permease subunit [Saprospiraceae bacterium]
NRNALQTYNLTILQILQAVQQANLDFPTGKIKNDDSQILIRLAGKFNSVNDLRELVVFTNPITGTPVKLQDVAEVQDTKKEEENISRVNHVNSIGITIQKNTDANAVAVSDDVRKEISALEKDYKDKNLKFSIASDQTDFTRNAVDAVLHDIMLAIILVAVVMLFFLHSIRNAVIVMLAIPASLISTFILMYAFDFTLNLMTLLAMSLVIGILVDDSIVVLENIYRHMEMGSDKREAALIGRNEIGFTALSITLVDVVVFFPIALTGGIVGNIMRQFALVVVFSTLMSLFVSFTITPMLASRFSRLEHFSNNSLAGLVFGNFEKIITKLTHRYSELLSWLLAPSKMLGMLFRWRAILSLIITGILFFSSFNLVSNGFIGTAFITHSDRGEFIIKLEMPKDASLKETNYATQTAEKYLGSKKEVSTLFTTVGITSGIISGQSTPNMSEILVKLVPFDKRTIKTELFSRKMKTELSLLLPGIKVQSSPVSFFGGADEDPIQVILYSSDRDQLMTYADNVLNNGIKKIKGTLEAELSISEGNPEINISIDRLKMADLGLNITTIGATMQTSFSGNKDVKFRDGSKEYDINIMLDAFDRKSVEDIAELTFLNSKGNLIKLSQFATITQTTGPSQLERKDRISSVVIKSKVLGRPEGTVGADIKEYFIKNPPPSGISIAYDGNMKNQSEGFGSLGLAFMASILFVYLIMVALYDSWIYPFVVLFSIPVALVGALLALALSMCTLDIFTILGIIMLVGLVGKNAILLVDFTNQMKAEGKRTTEALILAGRIRLRPILMTTIAMVIGMLPIAIAKGAGSEWKNGLAWAIIGGLISSTILTLVVVPIVYLMVDWIKAFSTRKYQRYIEHSKVDAGPLV